MNGPSSSNISLEISFVQYSKSFTFLTLTILYLIDNAYVLLCIFSFFFFLEETCRNKNYKYLQ